MRHKLGLAGTWAAVLFLVMQTVVSAVLFRRHTDGGAWPIILVVFLTIDLFYARFALHAAQERMAPVSVVIIATLLLAFALLIHNNFWLIFGDDTRLLTTSGRVVQRVFGSSLFPYAVYFVPVLVVGLWAKRREKAASEET